MYTPSKSTQQQSTNQQVKKVCNRSTQPTNDINRTNRHNINPIKSITTQQINHINRNKQIARNQIQSHQINQHRNAQTKANASVCDAIHTINQPISQPNVEPHCQLFKPKH